MRWSGLARTLITLSLVGLPLGCATVSPLPRFQLERAGESLTKSQSGRFVLKGTDALGEPQGTQGRFEWLVYGNAEKSRQALVLVGPLGQSIGVLEKVSTNKYVNVYDHQGLLLGPERRQEILVQVLGQSGSTQLVERETDALLAAIVRFFEQAADEGRRRTEQDFGLGPTRFSLTILLDA